MRFMVVTCRGGSRRFSAMREAVKYARGQSARPTERCPRVNVWRMQPERGSGREHGDIVAICKAKVCKPTGWLQRGSNPLW